MKSCGFEARRARRFTDWIRIYLLYRTAFPVYERKPFDIILSMQRKGKTDVWIYRQDGHFVGFAATINDEKLILLDYLAVSKGRRGRGLGSRILESLRRQYAGKGVFVEIESIFGDAGNLPERRRRREFYTRNGMESMHVLADVFGVRMELLGWDCRIDFESYRHFYQVNYSEYAAKNIVEAAYPGEQSAGE